MSAPRYRRKRVGIMPKRRSQARPTADEARLADNAIRRALRKGLLVRPADCERCGGNLGRIEAHHRDGYSESARLNVEWLCSPCHRRANNEPRPSERLLAIMEAALAPKVA